MTENNNILTSTNMVNARFSLSDIVMFGMIGLSIFAITLLPGVSFILRIVYFLQILLFLVYFSLHMNFKDAAIIDLFHISVFRVLALCLFVSFIISFSENFDKDNSPSAVARVLTYPFIFIIFFQVFPKKLLENEALAEKFLDYLVLFGVISSVIALLIFFSGIRVSQYYMTTANFYFHPYIFASWFIIIIPVVLYKYFIGRFSFSVFALYLFILCLCLLFTFSRGAYIGVAVSILFFTFQKSKSWFLAVLILLSSLALTIVVPFASSKGTSSLLSRSTLFLAAYNMIFNRGTGEMLWGYGTLRGVVLFQREGDWGGAILDPHNFILLWGISYGIIVTGIFLVMMFYILLRTILRKRFLSVRLRNRVNLCYAIVLGIFVHNLTDDILAYGEYFVMLFFLIFLGYIYQVGKMVGRTAKSLNLGVV